MGGGGLGGSGLGGIGGLGGGGGGGDGGGFGGGGCGCPGGNGGGGLQVPVPTHCGTKKGAQTLRGIRCQLLDSDTHTSRLSRRFLL